jgi:hypothetical protein
MVCSRRTATGSCPQPKRQAQIRLDVTAGQFLKGIVHAPKVVFVFFLMSCQIFTVDFSSFPLVFYYPTPVSVYCGVSITYPVQHPFETRGGIVAFGSSSRDRGRLALMDWRSGQVRSSMEGLENSFRLAVMTSPKKYHRAPV